MKARRLFIASTLAVLLATACTTGIVPPAGPAVVVAPDTKADPPIPLPNEDGSLRFAVFGDFGTASRWQYELANQMFKLHEKFPFELVLLAGDNLYGAERPQDFERKFEIPYKPLLDANVKFYAALGNHDDRNQRFYEHFNMEGKQYYSFKAPKQNVRFFALESTYPEPEQIEWVEEELKGVKRGLEDRVLPSSAVLVRRAAWIGRRSPGSARAALHAVQRERGVRWS